MKKSTTLAAGFLVVCVIAVVAWRTIYNDDIAISISETKDELTLLATFPDKDSKKVQDYIKAQLKLNELSDMKHLEVKHYRTPDRQMYLSIKSRDGRIKIVLDKIENSSASYRQLKRISDGLSKVLTQR